MIGAGQPTPEVALLAENQVKKHQMAMLVRLKNLLTAEQIAYLEAIHGKK